MGEWNRLHPGALETGGPIFYHAELNARTLIKGATMTTNIKSGTADLPPLPLPEHTCMGSAADTAAAPQLYGKERL